jgi:hypothetical protein
MGSVVARSWTLRLIRHLTLLIFIYVNLNNFIMQLCDISAAFPFNVSLIIAYYIFNFMITIN